MDRRPTRWNPGAARPPVAPPDTRPERLAPPGDHPVHPHGHHHTPSSPPIVDFPRRRRRIRTEHWTGLLLIVAIVLVLGLGQPFTWFEAVLAYIGFH